MRVENDGAKGSFAVYKEDCSPSELGRVGADHELFPGIVLGESDNVVDGFLEGDPALLSFFGPSDALGGAGDFVEWVEQGGAVADVA